MGAWGEGSLREKRPGVFEIRVAVGVDPVSGRTAAWISDIFVSLVRVAASEDDVRRAGRSDDDRRQQVNHLYETFAGLPPDWFPLIAGHASEMVAGDGDERFHFAVDALIDGVVSRAARQ